MSDKPPTIEALAKPRAGKAADGGKKRDPETLKKLEG
jgi:hypothetical protein